MIATDKRKAIYLLHQEGMAVREIARRMGISRSTVGVIIGQGGELALGSRSDKCQIEEELLRQLYQRCDGWVARLHEVLLEEEGVDLSYPTLTRMLRELGIGKNQKPRSERVADEPGVEMQHDTSEYRVKLADQNVKLIGSLIYLRYSKRRYLRFYRAFNRFKMKCFFHEALMFWGYSARSCIIDNTNLARLRGVGRSALMTAEMENFGKQYGFEFRCHEVGHCNRKAGEERSFWTVTTNFLPGRSFISLEDLNAQALEWATTRLDHKAQGKMGLIPAKMFEHECGFLVKLLPHLPAPYRIHERDTDQYGYISFGSNYYWVPQTQRTKVRVLEYAEKLKIYQDRKLLVEYLLPVDGAKNLELSPPGEPAPRHRASNRRHPTQTEEKHLRALSPAVDAYLNFVLPLKGVARHVLVRKLLSLSRRMSVKLLSQSLERALKYDIHSLETVERIAHLYLNEDDAPALNVEIDEAFRQRPTYLEGSLTDLPDLSVFKEQEPPTPL